MNISATKGIFAPGNEDKRKTYFDKLRELNAQKSMFINYTKQLKEIEKNNKKARGKGKKSNAVLVTGGTSKSEIRRLKRVLSQKISEVISETDENEKSKQLKVQMLQMKLEALERILIKIERIEQEQLKTGRRKRKEGQTESVYLSKDDLDLKKKNAACVSDDVMQSYMAMLSPDVDLEAVFENVAEALGAEVQISADGAEVDISV